ncbi:hypothetical protein M514_18224 [Trichuris suis]|uniref:Uncharacterized protein n=1 Tax=Trichuris suis TaxID=68888 RepID=A0A085NJG2_9BILA|nr:hypothetical protein M514_18224 [Trichuris suis]
MENEMTYLEGLVTQPPYCQSQVFLDSVSHLLPLNSYSYVNAKLPGFPGWPRGPLKPSGPRTPCGPGGPGGP